MRIVVHNQNAAHHGLPRSTVRLTDSAIDRVWIFAGANQSVNLISASMDVTVCPARCLGPIMEPSSTKNRADLASIVSDAGQARLTETSLRLRVSLNRSSLAIPARGIRGVASVSRIGSSWSGKLSWFSLSPPAVDPCQRKAVSRIAHTLQKASSALTFVAAMFTSAFVFLPRNA